ncbi:MAG: methyltransferase domain-containing protein [Candidatus Acidiferrales bacterium]
MTKPPPSLFGQPRAVVEAELAERELVRCPLCEADPKPFAVDPQGFQLGRCPRCGLEFVSPRPVLRLLAGRVYARDYHHQRADFELTPENRALFGRQLDRLEALLGRTGGVLDAGCGGGAFLRAAQGRGWEAAGTDIELEASARNSGARLWAGTLGSIDFGGERFDALRFHHVLEHTPNPLAELERARSLLKPQGVLYLSVPNLAGLSPRLKSWQSRLRLKARPWRHYAALHHHWFFTPATLRRVVERAGFSLARWETPVPPKENRPVWMTSLMRVVLERPRWGSILDFYCRLR